jgi:hypothetical protein
VWQLRILAQQTEDMGWGKFCFCVRISASATAHLRTRKGRCFAKLATVLFLLYSVTGCGSASTVKILLFFRYPKNGAESLLESQMNIKYDFEKILSLLSRRWNGLLCPQQVKNSLNREENFFSQKGSCRVSKNPSFYVDFKNVNLP